MVFRSDEDGGNKGLAEAKKKKKVEEKIPLFGSFFFSL